MRSEIRTAFAVLATAAVLLGSATMAIAAEGDGVGPEPVASTPLPPMPSPSPSESSPTPESTESSPTPEPTESSPTAKTSEVPATDVPTATPRRTADPRSAGTALTVDDAELRWGLNDESNNRAFAPGTVNFLSAGKIRNPGTGGQRVPEADWAASDGDVRVEKFVDGAWTSATWAGLSTTSAGVTMAGTNGPFSNHEVVIAGGKGTVDPSAGEASIQWSGSFTSVYYSGYSFFYVTDPKLTVKNGIGTLTGTLGGYASSMDDLDRWVALPDAPNTVLADLGTVDLTTDLGFSAQPAYKGVSVALGADQVPQSRSSSSWGSFPQSFVDFQHQAGTGPYWYSSGGSSDAHKVAKPITVSYSASAPVTPPPPTPTNPATPDPTDPGQPTTPDPVAPPSTTRVVNDAQLRWGINDESNNRAFAPGTFNFLSAGKIRNPGKGGQILPPADWKASDGNVTIEKFLNGAWTTASWAGLKTTSAGATMVGTNGPFSNHEVVISGGTGTVDSTTGTASIQWSGSFSVVYYSGYSFFYVTDPQLTVENGIGTLTGTLGGYASSMEDLDTWEAVPDAPGIVLANLGPVDLTADLGFSALPAYKGVEVAVGGGSPQVRGTANSGAFPQSFVDFQNRSGTGSYWYSSGGSADAHKAAKPVTVSYSASAPVKVAVPSTKVDKKKVSNKAPSAPNDTAPSVPNGFAPGLAPAGPLAAPAGTDILRSNAQTTPYRPAATISGLREPASSADATGIWILGGVLLGATLLVTVSPFVYAAVRRAD